MMALPVGEARKERASLGEKERVVLNIGGRRFETFRSTLLQHSGSLLETMFSDRNRDLLKPDKFGEYFFDRDSTCFEVILNYFRTGKLLLPSTINEDLFREECSFFQIEVEHEEEDPIAYTWGKGEHGQLGHGSRQGSSLPKRVTVPCNVVFVRISLGTSHSCALTRGGQCYSWGYGGDGRLGHCDDNDVLIPRLIEAFKEHCIAQIDCGELHTGATTTDGEVYTWGFAKNGRLGYRQTGNQLSPQRVLDRFTELKISNISCGGLHTACLSAKGEVFTFGTGKDGRLGLGSEEDMYTPEMVQSFDRRIVQIVCGGHHTAALDVDGNVWTFGFDDDGRLGHGVVGHQFLPLVIESLVRENIIQIACGCWHSAALSADGSIYTWGSCKSGQLGLGDKTSAHLPRLCLQGLGDRKIREIACGTTHTVAVDHEGTVWAWGKNEDGRLGLGDVDGDVTTPHAVNIPERMTHVAASVYGTAAWSVHDNAVYGDDA